MGEVRLLGPLEVIGPAGAAMFTGTRQRTLVGLLALRIGSPLSVSRIVDGLWGVDPPRTAARTLHSHFARVRRALAECGLPGVLTTSKAGHALAMHGEASDALRFVKLVADARQQAKAGEHAPAVHNLRAALALWRGDALQGLEPAGWATGEIDRLSEERLSAIEDLCDFRLVLGDHGEVAVELRTMLASHPFRERLVGMLMLALYRCGRMAESLEVYHQLREHLGEALGIGPSPDLQRMYTSILRQESSLVTVARTPIVVNSEIVARLPVPAQLPALVGYFTGREAELAALDRLTDDGSEPVAIISGSAGMGKSALAIEWGHRVRNRFPDGQIYLDLGGNTATGAMVHVLRALGVAADRIPAELREQVNAYRSLLSGRKVLLLLDNAHSAEEILPLVPADEGSLCLVTSRQDLTAVAVRHAVLRIELLPLEHNESLALLRRVLGAGRLEREPVAADDLVRICAGLPLALRVAAAKLAVRPRADVAGLVAEIAERRLDGLAFPGTTGGVRAVFDTAYHALSDPAARTFRLLGLHPGPSISRHLTAGVTGASLATADADLDELTTAHLVQQVDRDRYQFHDLMSWYARECAVAHEAAADRDGALLRTLDWYLCLAAAANRVLDPRRTLVQPAPRFALPPLPFDADSDADAQHVMSYLDSERPNLSIVVSHARDCGQFVIAWQLTYLLARFYDARGQWDRLEMCKVAISAAQAIPDPVAEGLMRNTAATALVAQRQFEAALDELDLTLSLTERSGDQWCKASAHNNRAVAVMLLGKHEEATLDLERAMQIYCQRGMQLDTALAHNNLADVHLNLGRFDEAHEHLRQGLSLVRSIGNRRLEALLLQTLGEVRSASGSDVSAVAAFESALTLRREAGDKHGEASTRIQLGALRLRLQGPEVALAHFRAALALGREVGSVHIEAMALGRIGQVYARGADIVAARRHLQAALTLRQRVPDEAHEAQLRHDLGGLALPPIGDSAGPSSTPAMAV